MVSPDDGDKDETVTQILVDVIDGAKTLLLNMHDGQNYNGFGNVCDGGDPGDKKVGTEFKYCLVEVDLADCPGTFGLVVHG